MFMLQTLQDYHADHENVRSGAVLAPSEVGSAIYGTEVSILLCLVRVPGICPWNEYKLSDMYDIYAYNGGTLNKRR
jgi:hypothetical protein